MFTKYHRPRTLEEALDLLSGDDAAVIAGGTSINTDPDLIYVVAVDLQDLGLSGIEKDGDVIRIGAMTRLDDLVNSGLVPDVLRDLAKREAPNTIRNAATIGGTIACAEKESQLLTGLLAYGAVIDVVSSLGGVSQHSLDDVLSEGVAEGSIITGVSLYSGGYAAAHRTARTPMDKPIVTAVAHRDSSDKIRLAIAGVAVTPVLVDFERIGDVVPPSDFRGTSEYRSEIAAVLAERALLAVEGGERT